VGEQLSYAPPPHGTPMGGHTKKCPQCEQCGQPLITDDRTPYAGVPAYPRVRSVKVQSANGRRQAGESIVRSAAAADCVISAHSHDLLTGKPELGSSHCLTYR